jgi:hypothetical protein
MYPQTNKVNKLNIAACNVRLELVSRQVGLCVGLVLSSPPSASRDYCSTVIEFLKPIDAWPGLVTPLHNMLTAG